MSPVAAATAIAAGCAGVFTSTPCHFGGERLWFQCPTPGCHRRAAKLYLGARVFACRRCYNLAYPL